jgi:hypothetical protein
MMNRKHLILGGYRQERIKKVKKKKLLLKKISFGKSKILSFEKLMKVNRMPLKLFLKTIK